MFKKIKNQNYNNITLKKQKKKTRKFYLLVFIWFALDCEYYCSY